MIRQPRFFYLVLIGLFISNLAHAQLNNWIGPATGDWGVGGNWSQGSIPDATDSVVIANAAVTISTGTHTFRNINMIVSPTTALIVLGGVSLNITNTTDVGAIAIFHNLTNSGQVQITANVSHNGVTFIAGGVSVNNATINMDNGGGATVSDNFTNNGTITIEDMTPTTSKGALRNLGKLTNSGFITIDGCTGTSSDGLTNEDTLINKSSGQITITNVDGLQAHGMQNELVIFGPGLTNKPYIHNQGKIFISNITGSSADGLYNQHYILNDSLIDIKDVSNGENLSLTIDSSTLTNYGEIRIDNALGYISNGIHISTNTFLINGPNGIIKILNLANASGGVAVGLKVDGGLINSGEVQFTGQTERFGIINSGHFINNHLISFNSATGGTGIQNIGYLESSSSGIIENTNNASFRLLENIDSLINNGIISNSSFSGGELIRNSGYFQNDSLIQFTNQTANFSTCINNRLSSEFRNNGTILFNNIIDGFCLSNVDQFLNYGMFKANNISSSSSIISLTSGELINHGTIDINKVNGHGIQVMNASLTNESSGIITIDSISTADFNTPRGLELSNAITLNKGEIHITNQKDGQAIYAVGSGSFTNMNAIRIDEVEYIFDAVLLNTLMVNQGVFRLSNVSKDAIYNLDTLINQDSLIIENTNGPALDNNRVFINEPGGTVVIHNTAGTLSNGIINNFSDIISNAGTIIIDSVGWNGIENKGTFTNKTGGNIEIDHVLTGSRDAVKNDSTFINEACASMILIGELENRSSFTNLGYIFQDGPFNFFLGGSTFNQEGVYVDVQAASQGLSGFQDLGIYINEIPGSLSCLDTITNFYTGTNLNNITATSITTDEAGTIIAGSVDLTANKIYLGSASGMADELYIPFNYGGNCIIAAKIPFANPISCEIFMEWTGAISSDWFTPGNWSLNRIPTLMDDVNIPAGSTVLVPLGFNAEALLLSVSDNVTLTVDGTMCVAGE